MNAPYPPVDGTEPCRQVDPSVFFPETGENDLGRRAKAICSRCHVERECLEFALSDPSIIGVYGGTSPGDREKIRAARARNFPLGRPPQEIRHGTEAGYKTHIRRHEKPCADCVCGNRVARRERAERTGKVA